MRFDRLMKTKSEIRMDKKYHHLKKMARQAIHQKNDVVSCTKNGNQIFFMNQSGAGARHFRQTVLDN